MCHLSFPCTTVNTADFYYLLRFYSVLSLSFSVVYFSRMGSRVQVLDNGTLIVHTVSDKDAGDYLCVARSKIGDDLQLMRVSVTMKPAKIEPKLYGKKQVPYGNDLKVDCKASGAPKPEISWGLPDGTVVNSALQSDASIGGGRARRYTLFDNGTLYVNQVCNGL